MQREKADMADKEIHSITTLKKAYSQMLIQSSTVFLTLGKLAPFVTAFFFSPNYIRFLESKQTFNNSIIYLPINLNYTHTFSFLPVTLSLCLNCNCNSKAFEGTCYIEGVILKITLYSKKKTLKDQNKQGLGIRKLHFYCIMTKNRKWLLLNLLDILRSKKLLKYDLKNSLFRMII